MDDRERTDRFSVYDFYAPCKKYEKSSAVTSEQSVEGGQFSVAGEKALKNWMHLYKSGWIMQALKKDLCAQQLPLI